MLLVHKPAILTNQNDKYGSGWDLIVPAGWAMPFLIAMVYRGARVGGIRELEHSDFEMSQFNFPLLFPDTEAGRVEEGIRRDELDVKHKRKPPAKRVNFEKLGIKFPHHMPWTILTSDWSSAADGLNTHVLRDVAKLRDIQQALDNRCLIPQTPHLSHQLVPVRLQTLSRGCCESLSLICIPSTSDIEQLSADSDFGGPKEQVHSEPPKHDSLRESCDRTLVGFISFGKFSFRFGQGVGLGFVMFEALRRLQSDSVWVNNRLLVLFRPQTSFQYRFALLNVAF